MSGGAGAVSGSSGMRGPGKARDGAAASEGVEKSPVEPVPRRRAWPGLQQWRLASGLVLLTFVTLHFFNHALGLVSVETMEAFQGVRVALWRSWPGTALLYGAFTVHLALALHKVATRRTWRMPALEAWQLGLASLIPYFLLTHVLATRGLSALVGLVDDYTRELRILWPTEGWTQSLLLLVVWGHGMIGLYFWLRIKRWFPPWRDVFLAIAVLLPALALAGWITGARAVAEGTFVDGPLTRDQYFTLKALVERGRIVLLALGLGTLAFVVGRALRRLGSSRIRVSYDGGARVRAVPGPTLLEISRMHRVPHTSVCGGRARCSTCRVHVTAGAENLDPPSASEAAVLKRIDAPPGVRLACRIRPRADLSVQLLLAADGARASDATELDPYRWGVERRVTLLFADIRGFTTLAERQYPYDVVFLLNRYLTLMTRAVEENGGQVDKFLGDGVMAIFGVRPQSGAGARAALLAARGMEAALDELNAEFAAVLPAPLGMGVGVHMGSAILGRVGVAGAGTAMALTALGDTVNTASRLQDATKDLAAFCVASEATVHAAGLAVPDAGLHEIAVRAARAAAQGPRDRDVPRDRRGRGAAAPARLRRRRPARDATRSCRPPRRP